MMATKRLGWITVSGGWRTFWHVRRRDRWRSFFTPSVHVYAAELSVGPWYFGWWAEGAEELADRVISNEPLDLLAENRRLRAERNSWKSVAAYRAGGNLIQVGG